MDFSQALILLKEGKTIRRRCWSGNKSIFLASTIDASCWRANKHWSNTELLPMIIINTKDGKKGAFVISNCDVLADDWEETEVKGETNPEKPIEDDEKPDSEDREEEHYFVESKPKVRKPNIENTNPVNFKITKEATEAKKENIDNEKQDNDKDKYTAPKKHYNNRGVIKIDGKTSILGDDGTLDGREPVSTTINGKFYVYTERFCNDKETGYTSMGIMLVTSHDYGGRTNKDGEACGPSLASRCSIGMSPLADYNRRTIYSNYAPGSSLIYEATDRDIRQFFDIWINEKDTNPLGESFEFYCRFDFNTKWLDPYKEKFGLKY